MPRKPKALVAPSIPPKPPLSPQDLALEQKNAAICKVWCTALSSALSTGPWHSPSRRHGAGVRWWLTSWNLAAGYGETLNAPDKLELHVVEGGKGSEEAREEAQIEGRRPGRGSVVASRRWSAIEGFPGPPPRSCCVNGTARKPGPCPCEKPCEWAGPT